MRAIHTARKRPSRKAPTTKRQRERSERGVQAWATRQRRIKYCNELLQAAKRKDQQRHRKLDRLTQDISVRDSAALAKLGEQLHDDLWKFVSLMRPTHPRGYVLQLLTRHRESIAAFARQSLDFSSIFRCALLWRAFLTVGFHDLAQPDISEVDESLLLAAKAQWVTAERRYPFTADLALLREAVETDEHVLDVWLGQSKSVTVTGRARGDHHFIRSVAFIKDAAEESTRLAVADALHASAKLPVEIASVIAEMASERSGDTWAGGVPKSLDLIRAYQPWGEVPESLPPKEGVSTVSWLLWDLDRRMFVRLIGHYYWWSHLSLCYDNQTLEVKHLAPEVEVYGTSRSGGVQSYIWRGETMSHYCTLGPTCTTMWSPGDKTYHPF